MITATSKGIVEKPSHQSMADTIDKLKNILETHGITEFALIDFSREADRAGMEMSPTKLLIFGSPRSSTPLLKAAPSIAIDLPLKILVREDDHGKVWVAYNSPEYLKERHAIPEELAARLGVVDTIAAKIADE
jgi:uncharacterized protein (DUF302 family)